MLSHRDFPFEVSIAICCPKEDSYAAEVADSLASDGMALLGWSSGQKCSDDRDN